MTVVLTLATACSDDAGGKEERNDGGAGWGIPGTPAEDDVDTATQPWVVDPAPQADSGDAQVLGEVRLPRKRSSLPGSQVGAAWTADQVVFDDSTGRLIAVDRKTGRQQWAVKMRSSLPGGDTVCELVLPSPDASTVVLNHGGGELCGDFTAYDLETGKVVQKYSSIPEEGREIGFTLASNEPLQYLDGRVYWVDADDNLRRMEDDGSSTEVGDLTELFPNDGDFHVSRFERIRGSDVFAIRIQSSGLGEESPEDFAQNLGKDQEDGFLVGFRIDPDSGPEADWTTSVEELVGELPGHVRGTFRFESDYDGYVADVQGEKGRRVIRIVRLDPSTGAPDVAVSIPFEQRSRLERNGIAKLSTSEAEGDFLLTGDRLISPFSTYQGTKTGFPSDDSLRSYDLTTGKELWRWDYRRPMRTASDLIRPLGVSADQQRVFAYTTADFEPYLREFDAESGKEVNTWRLPATKDKHRFGLDSANVYLNGDQALLVSPIPLEDAALSAALVTLE